jgi:hypothetical protein
MEKTHAVSVAPVPRRSRFVRMAVCFVLLVLSVLASSDCHPDGSSCDESLESYCAASGRCAGLTLSHPLLGSRRSR